MMVFVFVIIFKRRKVAAVWRFEEIIGGGRLFPAFRRVQAGAGKSRKITFIFKAA